MKKFLLFSVIFFVFSLVFNFSFKTHKIQNTKNLSFDSSDKILPIIEKKQTKEKIKILFVGDMMFDRGVRLTIDKKGVDSIFQNIKQIFENQDLVVGNLEGTITNNASLSLPNHEILRFTFDPKIGIYLKQNNFGFVSLANNHSLDFGVDGVNQTKNNLTNSGILFFGSANNNENLSQKIILNDKTFCFVGYHDLYTKDETPVLNEIEKIKSDCYKIIVLPHWGEEYQNVSNERQKYLAHKFIDSGADLIIGTHPHVIQEFENYNGKAIFYSLGNFVFDQYFSFETTHSLALSVIFEEKKIKFEVIPVKINQGIVTLADEESSIKILKYLGLENKIFSI